MGIESLDSIFKARRVAVIGASDSPASVGYAVLRNLVGSGFHGVVYPVNPKRESVQGIACYPEVAELPNRPDLAVICTPAATVRDIVRQCGEAGVRGVVVITAGFRETGDEGRQLEEELLTEARRFPGVRLIGPNCLGVIVPGLGLNASFTVGMPRAGNIAFISQSGALGTSILDWAVRKGIGFSHFVSVGNMLDVRFAELIDYFGQDPGTRSIILYIESIARARGFLSATRAFTRTKPIIAYKAGRFEASAKAASSHTGALMGADDVHDAAFQRAGIERVFAIDEMFDCAELLARQSPPKRSRIAIVTNAGGPGVMATDALIALGGELAELSESTIAQLDRVMPASWSHGNPVDVLGDAAAQRYLDAVRIVQQDEQVDAILIILTPQAMTDPTATARALAGKSGELSVPMMTAWLGGNTIMEGRRLFEQAGIPTYASPERAVRGLMHLVSYARNIETLYETPRDVPVELTFEADKLRDIRRRVLNDADQVLSEVDAKSLLEAYGIPTAMAVSAASADDVVKHARRIGYPVAIKVLSPQITHKTDVGGVALNIVDDHDARRAFDRITANAQRHRPDATIEGVTVQPMIEHRDAVEMILGAKKDPVFGSVIVVGTGGVTAEVWRDRALALPPLTEVLARRMLGSLRSYPLLDGYRGRPRVNVDRLIEIIIRFSYLIADSPNLCECDVNPLIVSPTQVIAADARIMTDGPYHEPDLFYSHLAIRPYPLDFVREATMSDGEPVTLRPIRPSDEPMWHEMLASCSAESLRARFFATIHGTTHEMATRYCYIDYDREMAIVAEANVDGRRRLLGVGRLVAGPDPTHAEYAVIVADPWQNKRLGTLLTGRCLEIAQLWGVRRVTAATMLANHRMIATFREHGFALRTDFEEGVVIAEKILEPAPATKDAVATGAG